MNQLTVTKRVCDHLGKYIFDRVWNEPYTEYRTNTRPRLLTATPVAGMFNGRYEQLDLPSTNSYYVYVIEFNQFRPIKLNATTWVSLLDYCNENCTDLQMYTDDGAVLWRKGIYIRQDSYSSQILVAVDSVMLHTIKDASYDPSKVFFTKYIDSDSVADNTIQSFQITAAQIFSVKQKDPIPSGTIRLYNGKMISGSYLDLLRAKGYVEVITDDDVISDIIVDVDSPDAPIYDFDDEHQRVLVHVPKADNPDYYLITHDSCDFYLLPKKMKDGSDIEINGVFVHQCDRRGHFHQVTFNDMSVDKDMLDEIAEDNGFDGYYLRVLVRTHKKKLGVARDAAYCDLLYTHTDDQIVKFLITGKRVKNNGEEFEMDFWRAKNLEQSSYSHVLANRIYNAPNWVTRVPEQCDKCGLHDVCTPDNIKDIIGVDIKDKKDANLSCPVQTVVSIKRYIDVLGYFNTLSLICRRVTNFKVTADGVHVFPVHVPLALSNYPSSYFRPVVYLNGLKLAEMYVSNKGDGMTYIAGLEELFFTDKIRLRGGMMWDADNRRMQITVDSSIEIKAGDHVTVELLPDIPEDNYDYLSMMECFDVHETDYEPLATRIVDGSNAVMHSRATSEYQFLNGRLLCEGIDYLPRRLHGDVPDVHETSGTNYKFHPHVQNVSYLKLVGNLSESVMTSDIVIGHCNGFLTGNRIEWSGSAPFWFDNLSVLSIGGKVCTKFEYDGAGIQVFDGEHVNGEPYMIRTLVPKQVLDILGDYKKEDDLNRMIILREYFHEFTDHPFFRTVIPKPHKIYSLYILRILKDYFEGKKTFECIDDPVAFEAQFAEYASYKNSDVIYRLSEKELSFVDVYPIYHNIKVSNRETRHKINFLTKMLTSSDVYKHREAVNV